VSGPGSIDSIASRIWDNSLGPLPLGQLPSSGSAGRIKPPAGLKVLTPEIQAIDTSRLEPQSEPIALGVLRRRNARKSNILSHAIT